MLVIILDGLTVSVGNINTGLTAFKDLAVFCLQREPFLDETIK